MISPGIPRQWEGNHRRPLVLYVGLHYQTGLKPRCINSSLRHCGTTAPLHARLHNTLTCCTTLCLCLAAACNGPFTVGNGTFPCDTISSGQSCTGSCNNGYMGDVSSTCTNGVYTVSGTCEPGKALSCVQLPRSWNQGAPNIRLCPCSALH